MHPISIGHIPKSKHVAAKLAEAEEDDQPTSLAPDPAPSSNHDLNTQRGPGSSLTPPPTVALHAGKAQPKPKPQPRKHVISEATLSDDSDANLEPPAKKKKHAKEAPKETGKVDLANHKLLLNIPHALELSNQCVEFTHATPLSVALAVIHSTIGCTDFKWKPELSYKLGNATKVGPAMSLTSAVDWKGCLDDVLQAENAKKAGMVIPVMIQVTDQVNRHFNTHLLESSISVDHNGYY
ncbi:hypothetical protein B0H17DRAFT_1175500 [Mycena rosella]|uniref:Uncharacterized protein n=1 Tax=Mycena rosella TaxID=1033263 RepID=A0AAD7GTT3_MYCRO|nr:hypothetical protein B0H17DRAFT_1175500 [Mycena rosella]